MGLIAKQCINGFMHANVAQRNRRPAIFEDAGNIVVGFQTHAARPFHIQNRCDAGFDPFQPCDAGHQRFFRQQQTLVEQFPERGFILFGFQRDARQVQADHADVVTAFVDHLTVFFVHAEEAAAAHRRFERAGDFNYLIVIQNIRVHALAGAFQCQLLNVVVGVTGFVI